MLDISISSSSGGDDGEQLRFTTTERPFASRDSRGNEGTGRESTAESSSGASVSMRQLLEELLNYERSI